MDIKNKKLFFISLITLGLTSIISQLIIIRELIVSFYGNEIFIGLALASWLLWVAIGAIIGNKIKKHTHLYLWTIWLAPLFLFLEILIICLARQLISTVGQSPDLLSSLIYTMLALAPLCLILGLQFTIGAKFWLSHAPLSLQKWCGINKIKEKAVSHLVNKAYLFENIGFIIGGVLFSIFLIKINAISITFFIAFINSIILLLLLKLSKLNWQKYLISIQILLIIVLIFSPISHSLNSKINNWRWPKQNLILSKNSLYHNLAITKDKEQYNFYINGLMTANSSNNLSDEILIHFPLLFSKNPQKILLIGNGLQNAINEILKHPIESVYYLELDPELIDLARPFINKQTQDSWEDKRVKITNEDAVHFLKNNNLEFDIIISNLGNPSTIALNRFYTKEFFETAKNHLSKQGIFATWLDSSPNYINEANNKLISSVYQTLQNVFNKVLILPEEKIYYIASQANIDYNPQPLINNYQNRNLNNKLVVPKYIDYRLTNDRIQTTLANINNNTDLINKNLKPNTYLFQNLFWINHFHPNLTKLLSKLTKLNLLHWLIILLSILIIITAILKKRKINPLPFTATIPDFTLFTIEIILILLFQTFYGYVYSQIAIIITLLLSGMVIGNYLGIKLISKYKITINKLKYIYLLIALYCLSLPFIFNLLSNVNQAIGIFIIFPFISLIIGTLNGLEFPITNYLYLQKKETNKISSIYSADQIGSALGALLASIIFLPIIGLINTVILLAVLNLFIIFVLQVFKTQKL